MGVIQEVVLPLEESSILILCGDATIWWVRFVFAALELVKTLEKYRGTSKTLPFHFSETAARTLRTISLIICLRETYHYNLPKLDFKDEGSNLFRLLVETRQSFATDPRDRIYVLLGMV
jgi:hypothetical protein